MKNNSSKSKPKLAAGDDQALERSATNEDIRKGDYTQVTELSYDEVRPS